MLPYKCMLISQWYYMYHHHCYHIKYSIELLYFTLKIYKNCADKHLNTQYCLFVCLFVCLGSSQRTCDTHTCCQAYHSGAVTTSFNNLGLSRPGIEPRSPACEANALSLRHLGSPTVVESFKLTYTVKINCLNLTWRNSGKILCQITWGKSGQMKIEINVRLLSDM